MFDPPTTKTEAAAYRYSQWIGEPQGRDFDHECCAYEVSNPTGWAGYQCSRKPGHGPGELYCKQHAQMVTRFLEREAAMETAA